MMSLGEVAAKLGLPVFPCGANKRPVVETGFKAATSDATEIAALFARPGAELIGMPTGLRSGLVAIDIDIRPGHTGMDWLNANEYALPETRTHKTRSGGLHLIFRIPEGIEIRNSASRIAPGVDVRGEGGYIILPPSPGYAVADESEPAEMPLWLIRACLPPEVAPQPTPAPRAPTRHGGTAYGLAALDAECQSISRAPFGRQEPTLNEAGLKVGALIAGGELEEGPAIAELLAAARFIASEPGREPWTPAEIEKKLRRAVRDGMAKPRQAPPRATPFWDTDAPAPVEDACYWASLAASASEDADYADEPQPKPQRPQPTRGLFPVEYFDTITPSLDAKDFVQGLLVEQSAAVVYGESNSGKTFWTTDLALHVGAGMEWNGRRVEQGGVVYCVLEGGQGFRNRVHAWRLAHDAHDVPVHFAAIQHTMNLLHPDADVPVLIATIQATAAQMSMPVKLVIIDTLSRALAGGDENSSEDMGALVKNMDRIRQETGACTLFVHHSGKDQARGARGWSGLRGAIDTEIEVKAEGNARSAEVVKQRDLKKGDEFRFELEVIEIGTNRHGEPVTTCLVKPSDDGAYASASLHRRRLPQQQQRALEVLADLVARAGQSGHAGTPAGIPSVPEKWWRDAFYERAMPGAEQEAKKRAYRRAADALVSGHLAGMSAGRVWAVHHTADEDNSAE